MRSLIALLLLFCVCPYALGVASPTLISFNDGHPAKDGYLVEGKVRWPEELASAAQVRLILLLDGGKRVTTWSWPDGTFQFQGVPSGIHFLEVVAPNLVYPQIRIEVDGEYGGRVTAKYADQPHRLLPRPLLIRPVQKAEYFEVKQPFNIIAFLKTPYGMMIAVGVLAVFVLPKMRIDPEEYKEVMEGREAARPRPREGGTRQPERIAGSTSSQGGGGNRRRRE